MSPLPNPQFSCDLDPDLVARFFLRADALRDEPDVTPLKLQKLLYFAQANYLASTSKRMFSANVEAFEHGPVVYAVWQRFAGREILVNQLSSDDLASNADLPEDVEAFLGRIWALYADKSANELRRITHTQAPWKDHYYDGGFRIQIPDEDMKRFFRYSVPLEQRVFHDSVVVIPSEVLDFDEDAVAREIAEFLAG